MVGGRAGWVYKHTYAIGGGFYGLLRDIEVEVPRTDSERDFEFAYGDWNWNILSRPVEISIFRRKLWSVLVD